MAKNTDLQAVQEFILPVSTDAAEFSREDIAGDMEGLELSFPRVKVPAGGGITFEIPNPDDPDNPDVSKTLEGVLLCHHATNGYWPGGNDGENTPPVCSSADGKTGLGYPGGACATCALNAWDSGEGGKGKACKNMHKLYLLRSGECLPLSLSLPPTSIKPFSTFIAQVFMARSPQRASWGSIIQIGLKKCESGGQVYSVCTFKLLRHFAGEELAAVKALAAGFKAQIMAEQQRKTLEGAPVETYELPPQEESPVQE